MSQALLSGVYMGEKKKQKNIISPIVIGHHNSRLAPTIDLSLCYDSVLGDA